MTHTAKSRCKGVVLEKVDCTVKLYNDKCSKSNVLVCLNSFLHFKTTCSGENWKSRVNVTDHRLPQAIAFARAYPSEVRLDAQRTVKEGALFIQFGMTINVNHYVAYNVKRQAVQSRQTMFCMRDFREQNQYIQGRQSMKINVSCPG